MYWPEVHDLAGFYETELGKTVRGKILSCINDIWPEANDEVTLGIGFAQPYLPPHLTGKTTVISAMPAAQGALHWPPGHKNLSFLTRENYLPFEDESIDRVIISHALEFTDHQLHMMNEIWRVLKPEGRIIAIVPNRLSIWARVEGTPFGNGHPFSPRQLEGLMEEASFLRLNIKQALFMPPTDSPFFLKLGDLFRWLRKFFPIPFGGALIMEAEKKIYTPAKVKKRVREEYSYEPAGAES